MTPTEAAAFIRANTGARCHPLVPEIRLMLADEMTPIWQASEDRLETAGVEPPFWAFAWPGGAALARYLLDHTGVAQGRRVFDVAAGCGIAAIAACRAGAAKVAAADIDPLAQAAIAANAALNDAEIEILVGDPLAAPAPATDLILAGDVFYERPLAEMMRPWLLAARAGGAEVLVADPGRAYLPERGLEHLAEYAVPTTLEIEDREMRKTAVYRLIG
ncbi:MAG: 50S ribosomal protein L11 methyltransferase [Alphaproteobacteria bacterium]|nr:50S ribosomal protein L11 methyltransferase [Alphaproteobacteria bacterium]